MLRGLHLVNFKSWPNTGRLDFQRITGLFGANSSGKTSLLQSILLLAQTTSSPDRNRVLDLNPLNGLIELGTYRDIVYAQAEESTLSFELEWDQHDEIVIRDLDRLAQKKSSAIVNGKELRISVDMRISDDNAKVLKLTYGLGATTFELTEKLDESGYDLASSEYDFIRSTGRAWPLPGPNHFYGFPDQLKLYYQNADFLSELELSFISQCQRIRYLGPLRIDPKRQYTFSGGSPNGVGPRGEQAIDALIAATQKGFRRHRGFSSSGQRRRLPSIGMEQLVAEWLQQLGLVHSFELRPLDDRKSLYRVYVKHQAESTAVLLTDVGFGVSQILPVLVLLAYAEEGDTVILEQPEIHLHPAVQAGLADIIIETALARNVQVVIESHSEHLLLRLQRRIAESYLDRGLTLTSDEVSLYFCQGVEGKSTITKLQMDLFGNIANWPTDFFGNLIADPIAMVEAASERSKQMHSE